MNPIRTLFTLVFLSLFSALSAQWTSLGGPHGGIAYHLQAGNTALFISTEDGLYRSLDQGATWHKPPGAQPGLSTWFLFDVHGDEVLAVDNTAPRQIRLSDDAGDTWTSIPLPDSIIPYNGARIGQRILLGRSNKIWESSDGGLTWIVSTLTAQLPYWQSMESFDNRFYLGAYQKMLISGPGGFNFSTVSLPSQKTAFNIQVFGSAILFYDIGEERIYRSLNGGQSWQGSNLADFGNQDMTIAAHNGALYTTHRDGLARSTNDGLSWSIVSNANLPLDTYWNYTAAIGNTFIIGDWGFGMLRTANPLGGPWEDGNRGLANSLVDDMEFSDDYLFTLSRYRHLGRYSLSQESWSTDALYPMYQSFSGYDLHIQNEQLFLADQSQYIGGLPRVGRSSDYGQSWVDITPEDQGPFGFTPLLPDRITGDGQALYAWQRAYLGISDPFFIRSTNNGDDWTDLRMGLFNQTGIGWPRTVLVHNGMLYAGGPGLARSPDGGQTWTTLTANLPASPGFTPTIFDLAAVDSLLFAAVQTYTGVGVYVSSDQGAHWTPAMNGLPNLNDLLYYEQDLFLGLLRVDGKIVASTTFGLFISPDNGAHWTPYPAPLPGRGPLRLHDDQLYLGTNGRGVWRGALQDFAVQTVQGRVFRDLNQNNLSDPGEPGIAGIVVQLDNQLAATDTGGYYSIFAYFDGNAKTLRARTDNLPFATATPADHTVGSGGTYNFAVYQTPGVRELRTHLTNIGRPRPGFQYLYRVNYKNQGTTDEDAVVELSLDPVLVYENAEPAPDQINGQTLRWNLNGLASAEEGHILIVTKVPLFTPLGTPVNSAAQILPVDGDFEPANNTSNSSDIVVGSYDPNDKRERHGGVLTYPQYLAGERLDYTIRFQNTGTYPAEKVVITDELPPLLDPATVQVLYASHPFTWSLRGSNLLEFTLDMINLPDSASAPAASQGFVRFSVALAPQAVPGNLIRNGAAIFFDFNPPIYTKLADTQIQAPSVSAPDPAAPGRLILFPNPTHDRLSLDLTSLPAGTGRLFLFHQTGQLADQHTVQTGIVEHLALAALPPGFYLAVLRTGERVLTGKVVVR